MSITLRGKYVGVITIKEAKANAYLVVANDNNTTGIIAYLGPEASSDLKEGMRVIFGDKRSNVKVDGSDFLLMEDDNITVIID